MRPPTMFIVVVFWLVPRLAVAQCGGEERWAVKMGADPDVGLVNLTSPITTLLHDLVQLLRPQLPPQDDDVTRLT